MDDGRWTPAGEEELIDEFGIDEDDLDNLLCEPERAPFLVHRGDLTVDGPLDLSTMPDPDSRRLYVVDGDLSVNGLFTFTACDVYTTMYVRGNLTAEHLSVTWEAGLIVGGSVRVNGVLHTYLSDAGVFVVERSLSARAWLELGERGGIRFARLPKAQLIVEGSSNYYFRDCADLDSV